MALSWSFPPFRLDLATGSLWRDDVLVPLPPKPFAVLAALLVHLPALVPAADYEAVQRRAGGQRGNACCASWPRRWRG